MQVILGEEDQRLSDTSSKIVSILNSSLLLSNVDDDDDTKRRYSLTSFYVEIALRRFYDENVKTLFFGEQTFKNWLEHSLSRPKNYSFLFRISNFDAQVVVVVVESKTTKQGGIQQFWKWEHTESKKKLN